jgi:hypothetical protein
VNDVPAFPCGHPKTRENTQLSCGWGRCKTCNRENARAGMKRLYHEGPALKVRRAEPDAGLRRF